MNALNHAFDDKQEGIIKIKVEQAIDKSVRLSVSDNGKGANNDTKADIFEPFLQPHGVMAILVQVYIWCING